MTKSASSTTTSPSSRVCWYRITAVLLVASPLLVPFYSDKEIASVILKTLTLMGCLASLRWLTKTSNIKARVGVGLLFCWYGLFSLVLLPSMLRGLVQAF